jgi:hypothetical protein
MRNHSVVSGGCRNSWLSLRKRVTKTTIRAANGNAFPSQLPAKNLYRARSGCSG